VVVKKMGFGTAFLSLCLYGCVQAIYVIPIGANEMKALTGETADGSAVTISAMDWEPYFILPDEKWHVSAWVQIKPATADTARLLQFKGFDGAVPVLCFVTWTSTAPPTFTFGATAHPVSEYTDNRPENVWFHLLMGSLAGTSTDILH
jgi:hypothetical protein